MTVGLQGSAQLSSYASGSAEQTISTGGPFAQFQISPYTRFLVAGGAQFSQNTGTSSTAEDQDGDGLGYYWSLVITNRLNAAFTHSVALGHERTFGTAADYQDVDYVHYDAACQLIRKTTLSGTVGYEKVSQIAGLLPEKYSRWTFGLAFGYQLTEHLRAALRYTLYSQDSDHSDRAYDQNLATLSLNYDF